MEKHFLEVCVDSTKSAIAAWRGGADRLELCANLIIGGTSPSPALFQEIRKHTRIPLHVLLRPRFGDFCYDDYEYEILKSEVMMFRELGAEGIVIGILKENGMLDYERMQELIALASGMKITLHRAFDMCCDPHQTLKEATCLGVDMILTSGQAVNCMQGKETIAGLVEAAAGKVRIMAGSGMSAAVAAEICQDTGVRDVHLSGKETKNSRMVYRKAEVSMGIPQMNEYEIWETAEANIHQIRTVLNNIEMESSQ